MIIFAKLVETKRLGKPMRLASN